MGEQLPESLHVCRCLYSPLTNYRELGRQKLLGWREFFIKSSRVGIPWWLWLGLDAFTAKGQGSTSVVRELRSCKACGMTKKKKFLRVLIVCYILESITDGKSVIKLTHVSLWRSLASLAKMTSFEMSVWSRGEDFISPFCCPENLVGLFSWWDVLAWSLCWEAVLCCLTIFLLCFFLWLLLIWCWSFQIGSVYHLSYLAYLKILIFFFWVIFFSQTVNCVFNFSNHIFKNWKILL